MDKHVKKMIAPIVITALVVLYYLLILIGIIKLMDGVFIKALMCIAPALLGATMIGVCIQRIKEIKGGEEDDLSKY